MVLDLPILTVMLLAPALGALLVILVGRNEETARITALAISFIPLVLSIVLLLGFFPVTGVDLRTYTPPGSPFNYRAYESAPWFPTAGVTYTVGVDELSVPLVFLADVLAASRISVTITLFSSEDRPAGLILPRATAAR